MTGDQLGRKNIPPDNSESLLSHNPPLPGQAVACPSEPPGRSSAPQEALLLFFTLIKLNHRASVDYGILRCSAVATTKCVD
ncbi:hypothetical protein NQZ68_023198 [Dissostichus eleginoides]|nr:hypothetical protein NQZ68_023198 [Dissostichus eleginoides]